MGSLKNDQTTGWPHNPKTWGGFAMPNWLSNIGRAIWAHPVSAAALLGAGGMVAYIFTAFVFPRAFREINNFIDHAIKDGALQWFVGAGLWVTFILLIVAVGVAAFWWGVRIGSIGFGLQYNLGQLDLLFDEGVLKRNALIQPIPALMKVPGTKNFKSGTQRSAGTSGTLAFLLAPISVPWIGINRKHFRLRENHKRKLSWSPCIPKSWTACAHL